MTGLDPGVVGEWLAAADDAPIPLPWRGEVFYASPPNGSRGKRIVAFIALSNKGERTEQDTEAILQLLEGEPIEVLALGRETYDSLVEAGMKPGSVAMARASNLALIRWGYGSEDVARAYIENVKAGTDGAEDEPSPKSQGRSRRSRSRSGGSARRTRSQDGSPTTPSPQTS